MANAIILNIPHSSTAIPNEFKKLFTISDDELKQELISMTDWYTDELFDQGIGKAIIAPVSRLICDTERFSHDEDESMANRGMGFYYTHGSRMQRIKREDNAIKDEILWRYYAPHHIALTDATKEALEMFGKALLIDCHSFSSFPLPYETERTENRPDICIGTDLFHTPKVLEELTVQFFKNKGLNIRLNYPYLGSIVPIRYYGKEKKVLSIMIEINRKLYINEAKAERNSYFSELKTIIKEFEAMLTGNGLFQDAFEKKHNAFII